MALCLAAEHTECHKPRRLPQTLEIDAEGAWSLFFFRFLKRLQHHGRFRMDIDNFAVIVSSWLGPSFCQRQNFISFNNTRTAYVDATSGGPTRPSSPLSSRHFLSCHHLLPPETSTKRSLRYFSRQLSPLLVDSPFKWVSLCQSHNQSCTCLPGCTGRRA